jgi:hypothetical protein
MAGVKPYETSFRALISPGSTRDRRLVERAGFAFEGTASLYDIQMTIRPSEISCARRDFLERDLVRQPPRERVCAG